MMEELENAHARLSNVRTVEPILGALRTISLGSWRAVLAQRKHTRYYGQRLATVLAALRPTLQEALRDVFISQATGVSGKRIVLAIGSERGLCGGFNASVLERVQEHLDAQATGFQVELFVLGTRLARLARRAGRPLTWLQALSVTSLPPFRMAFDMVCKWLSLYGAGALDVVDVVYNAYQRAGEYKPTVVRLIPPVFLAELPNAQEEIWPSPIVETDPLGLYTRLTEQYTALRLYDLLLDSAAAEHSTRYQLMEAALQNANRLIEELTLAVQSARRQAITREMQELAVGAGLLGRQRR